VEIKGILDKFYEADPEAGANGGAGDR